MKTQTSNRQATHNHEPEIDRILLIQQRAYELYLRRGRKPGHELEDWLKAEQEIRAREENQRS